MSMLIKKILGIGVGVCLLTLMIKGVFSTPIISNPLNASKSNIAEVQVPLTQVYDNPNAKFSIHYPADWIYDDASAGVVLFSGKKDTPAYYSTVDIQIVRSKKAGGEYKNIKSIIEDIKSQILKESPRTNFISQGPFNFTMKNGETLNGEFLIFIYSYKGNIIEQWQIALPGKDSSVFYSWAYTAPIDQYTHDLPIAKSMLASWLIY